MQMVEQHSRILPVGQYKNRINTLENCSLVTVRV